MSMTAKASAYSGTDATSYATASVTPGANKLQLIAVDNSSAADPATLPTLSGAGLTWVQVQTVAYRTGTASNYRITLFRALGPSPTTGAVTIDFGGVTQTHCAYCWDEVDSDVDQSGSNGSGAIQQAVTGSGTGVTVLDLTLASFTDIINNKAYAAFGGRANATATPEIGWTELGDVNGATPIGSLNTQYITGQDLTPETTKSASVTWGGIAVEIKSAVTGAVPNIRTVQSNLAW